MLPVLITCHAHDTHDTNLEWVVLMEQDIEEKLEVPGGASLLLHIGYIYIQVRAVLFANRVRRRSSHVSYVHDNRKQSNTITAGLVSRASSPSSRRRATSCPRLSPSSGEKHGFL